MNVPEEAMKNIGYEDHFKSESAGYEHGFRQLRIYRQL